MNISFTEFTKKDARPFSGISTEADFSMDSGTARTVRMPFADFPLRL